jgi:hypothetical protein
MGPHREEQQFLEGDITAEELHGKLVSDEAISISLEKKLETTGGAVVHFGRLDDIPVVLKETQTPLVSEAVFTRLLNAALPGSAPEVLHITEKQILMRRAQMVVPGVDKMDMLVQILDKLQALESRGIRFRHGDLHMGNIVRVKSPVHRHRKRGNAFKPTGDEDAWYNMCCEWTYQLIDFEMSALRTSKVTYEVPNPMYSRDSVFSTQHDVRILMTALYEHFWIAVNEDNTKTKLYKAPRCCAGDCVSEGWFAYFVRGVICFARAQSRLYDATLCVATNNDLRCYLLGEDNKNIIRNQVCLTPKWKMIWNAFPEAWKDLIGNDSGRVPFTHMQYYGMCENADTTVFEPCNMMKLCCWYQAQSNMYVCFTWW